MHASGGAAQGMRAQIRGARNVRAARCAIDVADPPICRHARAHRRCPKIARRCASPLPNSTPTVKMSGLFHRRDRYAAHGFSPEVLEMSHRFTPASPCQDTYSPTPLPMRGTSAPLAFFVFFALFLRRATIERGADIHTAIDILARHSACHHAHARQQWTFPQKVLVRMPPSFAHSPPFPDAVLLPRYRPISRQPRLSHLPPGCMKAAAATREGSTGRCA